MKKIAIWNVELILHYAASSSTIHPSYLEAWSLIVPPERVYYYKALKQDSKNTSTCKTGKIVGKQRAHVWGENLVAECLPRIW
jgi:hypothetical protein